MTYRPGFSDFFMNFRGQECIVIYSRRDAGDWWISLLNEDGTEGKSFQDLTDVEEQKLCVLIGVHWEDNL